MDDKRRGSFWNKLKAELIYRVLWLIATGLAASARYRVEGRERLLKMVADGKGGVILIWHGSTLLPIYYCRHMGFYSLVSVSKDGDLQSRLLHSRGFRTIRGSTARHAVRALLNGVRCIREGNIIALTPDGPKGPPKKVQPGAIHMAQRSGCPVLPVGMACSSCKTLTTWDSHVVPLPFSRTAIVFGDPLYISEDEDEAVAVVRVEEAINQAERRAEEILNS